MELLKNIIFTLTISVACFIMAYVTIEDYVLYFRSGYVVSKYEFEPRGEKLYIITIQNKDNTYLDQDFRVCDYAVSKEFYDSAKPLVYVDIPSRFKPAYIEDYYSKK